MSDPDCGCFGGTTGGNSATPVPGSGTVSPVPDGTSEALKSTPCPAPEGTCFTSYCHDSLEILPKVARMELVGVSGKCLYRFNTSCPGMIMSDGNGGMVMTQSPMLDLPQLVSYLDTTTGKIVRDGQGNPIEGVPPEFNYIQIQQEDGSWMKLRGASGTPGMIAWDGETFGFMDFEEANLAVTQPTETTDDIVLVGYDEDGVFSKFADSTDGILHYNPETGGFTLASFCDFFASIGGITKVPFLASCSGESGVRFVGGTNPAVIVWDSTEGDEGFKLVELDEEAACSAECCTKTELSLQWRCDTGWVIEAPETHVLYWKGHNDSAGTVTVPFTLPWPAMVTVYARRRLRASSGNVNTVSADIVMDSCIITSPSDGGMTARLDDAGTNVGVGVVSLSEGDHSVTIGNTQSTTTDAIQWSGGWIKVVAHKITDCNPTNPTIGGGSLAVATGSSGEGGGECTECPPGEKGDQGPAGEQGVPGPEGPPGPPSGVGSYAMDECDAGGNSIVWKTEDVEGVETFFMKTLYAGEGIEMAEKSNCQLEVKLKRQGLNLNLTVKHFSYGLLTVDGVSNTMVKISEDEGTVHYWRDGFYVGTTDPGDNPGNLFVQTVTEMEEGSG